jgi:glycosyltransferase involved in cell wall biosynthesis
VSDRDEMLAFHLHPANLGAGSLVVASPHRSTTQIPCVTLLRQLQDLQVEHVDVLKIDIEGAEEQALRPFLQAAPESLLPRCDDHRKFRSPVEGGSARALPAARLRGADAHPHEHRLRARQGDPYGGRDGSGVKPDAIADPAPPRLVARGHAGDTMPTIGIDATGLHGMTFGIHVYAGRLVESILAKDDRHRFTIFCRKDIPPSFLGRHPKVSFRIAPFGNRKFCEQCWLSWELARAPVGLFHATYGGPLYAPSPIVLTVHDLFHLRYPDRYPRWRRLYTRTAVVRTARRARAIITVSEATRRDVIDLLGIAPERVTTIHSGVDFDQFRPASAPERALVLRRHSLPSRYFLHVGGFSPIKNTERIVEAFAHACREPALRDVHLVFAGKKSAHYGDTAATARGASVWRNACSSRVTSRPRTWPRSTAPRKR